MKIFTLLHKSTDKGTINLGQWSRMGTVNVRTTSDSILSRICLASLILLMLGGFSSRAWGATCYVYEETTGATRDLKAGTVFETDVFENTDGIDYISFTYHTPGTLGYNLKVEYSTDGGESYTWLDNKGKSNKDKEVDITLTGAAKRANRFKFSVNGGPSTFSYEYAVKNIKIRKAPTVNLNGSSTESYEFSQTAVDASADNDFTVTTFNVGDGTPSVSISGTNSSYFGYFLSSATSDCPKRYVLTISYTPGAETVGEAKHSATVKVLVANKDTATLTVSGTARVIATPEYTWKGVNTYLVGDELDLRTLWESTSGATRNFSIKTCSKATGSNNNDSIQPAIRDNRYLSLGKACSITIKVEQDATTGYSDGFAEETLTVNKRSNALKCAWAGGAAGDVWNKRINYYSETGVVFSSNNDAVAPIVVTPTSGESVATYNSGANKIVSNYREGTAIWSVSQAEDYKYEAAVAKNCTITVGTVSSPGCDIYSWACDQSAANVGTIDLSDEGADVGASGTLTFNMKYRGTSSGDEAKISFYRNGSWSSTQKVNATSWEYEDTEISLTLDANTEKIKFEKSGSDDPYINNINITRKEWFKIKNAAGDAEITELTMPTRTLVGDSTVATFKVDYSTCASTIKVVSNNPHIVVAASDRSFSSTTHSVRTITLKYSSDAAETIDDAIITIYTAYEHKTLTVNAETKGALTTTIEYIGAASYAVDHANMNATDLFQVRDQNGDLVASPAITLSSNATGVINTVSSNTAIVFICGGSSATITASYAGVTNVYEAADNLAQTITVNKLSDAIVWSSEGDDGKIHVLADTDIPTSIASANTDIASYSVASANPYLSVTEVEGVYTLHAGNVGEVALTATSEGDCTYAAVSGSKTIAVDPREHAIIWDQDLEGIQTDDRGYITNHRITLNAYAVDNGSNPTNVPVSYEITGGGTFATIENGNELVINVANLSGTLSTTITATTTVGTKYAIVSETKPISVVKWGTNTATSANSTSDIEDGKIVMRAPHAIFTFSGETEITTFGYAYTGGKPEGYKLAQKLDSEKGTKTYNFSWESTNANCSIQVTKISFWMKAYNSNAFNHTYATASLDGEDAEVVGTAALTANDGDFTKFSKAETYANRNVPVVCEVLSSNDFDYYIKNISIEYTVYTTAPSATSGIEEVDRTINAESDKKTVDVRDLFSYAVAPPSDFEYAYEIVGAPEHAFFLADGYMFWADAVGDYTVRAKVTMDEDHRESDWSDEKTIRVNRVPYVFNNSAADKNWETTTNWRIGGWPIENLPTADDDVIVRGQLSVSEEIPVRSLTIDGGLGGVVEIAPTGGLTVGAGGFVGSTSDKLILKASTAGKNGYLRVSPEYAGEMPNATIEYYCTGYYDQTKSGDNAATYQCVGAPITASGVRARDVYPAGTYLYTWNESTGAWTSGRAKLTFSPFQGFETSQRLSSDGWKAEYEGQLVSGRSTWTIDLAYTDGMGYNLLANSFAAPIAIENFEEDDFVNADQLIYILNAGTRGDSKANEGDYDAPGKWVGIPIKTASELAADGYPCMIPCMQGFWIKATGSSAQLKLDYSRLVWGVNYSGVRENKPLRAPKRASGNEDAPVTGRLKVNLFSETENDFVYLLESERYSTNYENGYDARKMYSGDVNIFTIAENEELSVDATNSIIGTRVGVHTGAETAYTLEFSHLSGENELALRDNETNEVIDINEGTQYTFFAEPNSVITERFQIVARQSAPSITTGVEKAENDTKVHKFIKDDQLYILKNGVLYNAMGAIVR